MAASALLAVPNVSEGREIGAIEAIGRAFTRGGEATLVDTHSDADHHRSVFTLAGRPGGLWRGVLAGVREALRRIDVGEGRDPADIGQHPHVGAVDVVPIVYLNAEAEGAACAEALIVAHEIGEGLGVPVFLYGRLARARTRAQLRRGGVSALSRRMRSGELKPDFGPPRAHPTAGATLVAAREPLVAFNLQLAAPAKLADAKRIAAAIREGGREGLPGLRAIGVALRASGVRGGEAHDMDDGHAGAAGSGEHRAQVSMNVEQPLELPLGRIVEAVRRHAEVASAELVGLAPRAAFDGFPRDIEMPGFDPETHVIENALGF